MKVFMLTQGNYSSYEVVAIFTTRELAQGYALALSTKEHEEGLKRARADLEQYDREGSSWDEKMISNNWNTWSKEEGRAERNAKEVRDSRRDSYLASIEYYETPVNTKIIFDPDTYGGYQIEEQDLYDMVPVVTND